MAPFGWRMGLAYDPCRARTAQVIAIPNILPRLTYLTGMALYGRCVARSCVAWQFLRGAVRDESIRVWTDISIWTQIKGSMMRALIHSSKTVKATSGRLRGWGSNGSVRPMRSRLDFPSRIKSTSRYPPAQTGRFGPHRPVLRYLRCGRLHLDRLGSARPCRPSPQAIAMPQAQIGSAERRVYGAFTTIASTRFPIFRTAHMGR